MSFLPLNMRLWVLPLLAIVLAFALALGNRGLSEEQGRVLKLLSGLMMLDLGSLLLVAPERLGDPWAAALMLGVTLTLASVIALASSRRGQSPGA